MTKELKFLKDSPQGKIDLEIAIKGKLIAVKKKQGDNSYANQFIAQYKSKGVSVVEKRDFVVVNIFSSLSDEQRTAKIGQIEIDFDEDSEEQIETKLTNFYLDMFSKAGFEVQ